MAKLPQKVAAKKWWKKFVVLLVVLTVAVFAVDIFLQGKDPIKLSKDQKELVSSFGYPDTFMISASDEVRFEIWNYYDLEKSFSFAKGNFIEDSNIPPLSDDFDFPTFRPTQFAYGMNADKLKKIIGEPTIAGEINPELLEDAYILDFHDQVKVGLQDEKLVYVQTMPVFIPEKYRVEK